MDLFCALFFTLKEARSRRKSLSAEQKGAVLDGKCHGREKS